MPERQAIEREKHVPGRWHASCLSTPEIAAWYATTVHQGSKFPRESSALESREQQAIEEPADRGNSENQKETEAQDHFMDRG
ncbi:hypothetical protein [Dyella sp.]|uniref:hypothetical protein n=1 Tax=Dyella sp. TaxID=1869338 RepID=UPI002D7904E5|nr:hypothetical protein [Dyella sp.]HET7330235.1 hypothetical protein [Dyella sp.]